jgi:hypothetical protein
MNNIHDEKTCELCKKYAALFTIKNDYGGLIYLCAECAYNKGYISAWGIITYTGDKRGIEQIINFY